MGQKKKEPGRYAIAGKEYQVGRLTFDQKVLIFDVLAAAGLEDALDMSISRIIRRLAAEKLIHRLLAIVLEPVNGEFTEAQIEELIPEIGKLRDDDVVEGIITDFLHVNEKFISTLKRYGEKLKAFLVGKGFLASTSGSSSTGPRTAISRAKN